MVHISQQKTLLNTYVVTVVIDGIGKSGKPQKNIFEGSSESEIKVFVSRLLCKKVKECLQTFTKLKEQRSIYSKQNTTSFNAVSALKNEVLGLSLCNGDFWLKLKKNVLPAVEATLTPNTQSRYYQYDKDVYNFLNASLKPFQNVNL